MSDMRKDNRESGMIVVEAVISFTAFIMVCLGIVFMTNIFMLHNRVQFAINSAAHEIASYSYVYDALGLRDAELGVKSDSEKYTKPINETAAQITDTLNNIQNSASQFGEVASAVENIELSEASFNQISSSIEGLKDSANTTIESGKKTITSVKNLFSDGNALIVGMIYMGADYLGDTFKRAVATGAAWGFTKKYLDTDTQTADQYLRAYGVVDGYEGLDFSGSSVFCDDGLRVIDLVVEYDVDLSFINFVFPSTKVHVVQRVSVGSWGGGDGRKVNA
ncbi:MAG: pilus assembly protein [Clostridia bacterium]|nr:pilus assembly protein [Clostridia bacterium]